MTGSVGARPRRILAVMNEDMDHIAVQSAAALADLHDARLDVFVCLEPPDDIEVLARLSNRSPTDLLRAMQARRRADIQAVLDTYLPGRAIELHLRTGKRFIEVIRHVLSTGTDFVVKTAEPLTGMHRFLYTSTDQHLLRKCPCPVWLQTPTAKPIPRRILAAVDVDAWHAAEPDTLASLNRQVIDVARNVAPTSDAEIVVLHAWDAIGEGMVWAFSATEGARIAADAYVNEVLGERQEAMRGLMREVSETKASTGGAKLVTRLVRGAPEQVIKDQSRDIQADVVVMGTVARTGLSGVFIGNTAENIINSLECPVLAVKPSGFVSPLAR
ncbi:universal stress protein [Gymnodinialimonas sp. 2305UL16-5]|uniref:universal stress protein n=1 Tax=Gymnodinialimonas mytili TaxID=3126503 RepID=UPI0030A6A0A9